MIPRCALSDESLPLVAAWMSEHRAASTGTLLAPFKLLQDSISLTFKDPPRQRAGSLTSPPLLPRSSGYGKGMLPASLSSLYRTGDTVVKPPRYNGTSMSGISAEAVTIIRENNDLPTGALWM